ncbi:hypothetical protein ACOME3_002387 [Neoechinorhynchus agilis]
MKTAFYGLTARLFFTSSVRWVPSHKGLAFVCLQLQNHTNLSSSATYRIGLYLYTPGSLTSFEFQSFLWLISQNGWVLLCPHEHQRYTLPFLTGYLNGCFS